MHLHIWLNENWSLFLSTKFIFCKTIISLIKRQVTHDTANWDLVKHWWCESFQLKLNIFLVNDIIYWIFSLKGTRCEDVKNQKRHLLDSCLGLDTKILMEMLLKGSSLSTRRINYSNNSFLKILISHKITERDHSKWENLTDLTSVSAGINDKEIITLSH